MKRLSLLILVLTLAIACGTTGSSKKSSKSVSTQNSTPVAQKETIRITNNDNFDVSFEDIGFYNWLKKQQPKSNFLRSSLEIANLQYVTEWNKRVDQPDKYNSQWYTKKIDYKIKPRKHYGLDVNYELYMYFKFFEEKHEVLLETH